MMRTAAVWTVVLSLVILFGFNTTCLADAKLVPQSPVDLSKEKKVTLRGTGFEPGQKVRIVFTTPDGIGADIGYALDPQPVADDKGEWETTWNAGRSIKKKIVKAGQYRFSVTDEDYNTIATATVVFTGKPVKK